MYGEPRGPLYKTFQRAMDSAKDTTCGAQQNTLCNSKCNAPYDSESNVASQAVYYEEFLVAAS